MLRKILGRNGTSQLLHNKETTYTKGKDDRTFIILRAIRGVCFNCFAEILVTCEYNFFQVFLSLKMVDFASTLYPWFQLKMSIRVNHQV